MNHATESEIQEVIAAFYAAFDNRRAGKICRANVILLGESNKETMIHVTVMRGLLMNCEPRRMNERLRCR